MVFSSYLFLFIFLPIFLALYLPAPRSCKNLIALVLSYIFYAWGSPLILPLLITSSAIDYCISKNLKDSPYRRHWLATGIVLNMTMLGYYKYANFFVIETSKVLSVLGIGAIEWSEIALPIGISFFTFQKISYLVDVYSEKCERARCFIDYGLYVALFPQLIAGPIVRFHDIAEQIHSRTTGSGDVLAGAVRFSIGLGKKVLIADTLGAVADNVFGMRSMHISADYAWLGLLCYAFQIYFDFAGYSDMAIGLGRMMGFRFLENFDQPYLAKSFTEFWRRWHISLGNWMKEYLYIPLGGNRVPAFRQYLNLWIVFLLSGLWHGASWNFLLWGAFHGLFLSLDKLFWSKLSKHLPATINIGITFFLVLLSWVFFRCDTLEQSTAFLSSLFDLSSLWSMKRSVLLGEVIHTRAAYTLCIACLISFVPRQIFHLPLITSSTTQRFGAASHLQAGAALVILCLCVLSLSTTEFTPFLYFRF